MKTEELIMDRAFDSACVSEVDKEWSTSIYNRIVAKYPEYRRWIEQLIQLYKEHLAAKAEYCTFRRDYMIKNKGKIKLRFQ